MSDTSKHLIHQGIRILSATDHSGGEIITFVLIHDE